MAEYVYDFDQAVIDRVLPADRDRLDAEAAKVLASAACPDPKTHAATCCCGFGAAPQRHNPLLRCRDEAHHAPDCKCAALTR